MAWVRASTLIEKGKSPVLCIPDHRPVCWWLAGGGRNSRHGDQNQSLGSGASDPPWDRAATAGLGGDNLCSLGAWEHEERAFKGKKLLVFCLILHTSYDFASMKHPLKAEEAKTAVWREHIRIRTLC